MIDYCEKSRKGYGNLINFWAIIDITQQYYDDVDEEQELVVSHKDMDCEEWIKIRSFASAVEFYYYNKMLQIPLML